MRNVIATVCALSFAIGLIGQQPANADGLLYQLPKDGSWVKFNMKMTQKRGDQQRTAVGSLTMAMAGSTKENGETCRYIEFHFNMKDPDSGREQKVVAKALIPEKHLKKGADPTKHILRGWLKEGDGSGVEDITKDLGPMPAFLAAPLENAGKLEKKTIESKLGKLECEGVTGTTTFAEREGSKRQGVVTFETRLHNKAPFGVVSTTMQYKSKNGDQVSDRGTITLTLAEVGKDFKSKLPDSK